MMDIPYRDFAHSHPFHFLVGPEARSFYIHSGLVQQHSETLAALVGGGMFEAEERCAKLDDIDGDTFLRFVEFAYTGDYSVADPGTASCTADGVASPGDYPVAEEEPATSTPNDGYDQPSSDPLGWKAQLSGKGRRKNSARMRNLWVMSNDEEPPLPPPADDVPAMYQTGIWIEQPPESKPWQEFLSQVNLRETAAWQPQANIRPDEDHRPVFLCHASLYVFSDRYSIGPLQTLVLQKLRLTLSRFTLFPERAGDIVELLQYTYANTMDHDHGIDKLRDLVIDYIACQIRTIGPHPDFLEYLKEKGFAAKDIMVKLVQQL